MSELSSWPVRAGRLSVRAWMAFLVVGSLGLGACHSVEPVSETPPSLFLELRALTGEPVPDAPVYPPSGEQLQSDAWGQLSLPHVPPGRQLLRVEAPGFVPSLRALDVGAGVHAGIRLELLPLGTPVATFNTREGATFEKADIHVSVPPGNLYDAEGHALGGEVEAYLAPLDLNDLDKAELLAAPGELRGVLHPGAPPVNLESVALMTLSFQQKPGADSSSEAERTSRGMPFARRLGIRGSVPHSVIAHVLPPAGGRSAGFAPETEVPLWRLDMTTGLWVPTGDMATIGADGQTYELTLDHPAPLLHLARPFADHPAAPAGPQALAAPLPAWRQTACLAVRVEDEEGQAVGGRTVVALGVDYVSVSRAVTDGDGRALLEVMRDRTVRLSAGTVSVQRYTSREAGTCTGDGAAPTDVTLRVPAPVCIPGAQRACAYAGPEGTLGVGLCRAAHKTCDVNGGGWSATCQGEVRPQPEQCDNARDDDCDGLTNEGCPVLCVPGEQRPCYEGPAGTRDVGVCRGGVRTCEPGGTVWSACKGQVLPAPEDCSRPEDENCDGVACRCHPGERNACAYGGPAGTLGVGACQAGTRTCEGAGTGWSACTGEVVPQAENCANDIDDDCNGRRDDALTCLCKPGTNEPCYSGPAGTLGVGVCHGGTRTCEPSGTAWGACAGEVVPHAENCANGVDDDCNGQADELSCHWSSARSMVSPRAYHQATLLGNGQVLVSGGLNGDTYLKTAEVYDPVAGTWSSVDGMNTARAGHSATLLKYGRVLVSGGQSSSDITLGAAEVYDPVDNRWSSVASMKTHRAGHTATLLNDGRVLVLGGRSGGDSYLNTAEVYDPNANTWSSARPLAIPRAGHTATLLATGKVLVAGGYSNSTSLNTAEVYDPNTRTWSSVDVPPVHGAGHTATLLATGKVLVAGGYSNSTSLNTAEVYDSVGNRWSPAASMQSSRSQHTATLLDNGTVFVSGGRSSNRVEATAEVYDPTHDTWSPVGAMTSFRCQHTATLMHNGKVLVVGGLSDAEKSRALSTVEIYSP